MTETTVVREPLTRDELTAIDAWWRAANYLSVGQIYLLGNPLLAGRGDGVLRGDADAGGGVAAACASAGAGRLGRARPAADGGQADHLPRLHPAGGRGRARDHGLEVDCLAG